MRTSGLWCAVIIATLTGCDGSSGSDSEQPPPTSPGTPLPPGHYTITAVGGAPEQTGVAGEAFCENFTAQLVIKDRMSQPVTIFNPNEDIRFEMSVTNRSAFPQSLPSGASCFPTSFSVKNHVGKEVWNNVHAIMCIARYMPQQFAPLQTITHSATWNQVALKDPINPPGSEPSALPKCRTALSATAILEIR
jgi:hypothetical protein